MKLLNRHINLFNYFDDSLERNILLRSLISSLAIISFYSLNNILTGDIKSLIFCGIAFVIYIPCYLYIANTKRLNTGKRIVITLYLLSTASSFFNQGGLFGVGALNLCGLIIIISAVFSGVERRFFTTAYINMLLFFVWVHLFQNDWIVDYRSLHSEIFLAAETLIYIFYILYIGYLYKSEYEKKRLKLTETNNQLEEANAEISAQNDYITSYNSQLKTLVEELQAERNKVLEANQELLKANLEIAKQNEYITTINTQLEDIVAERTKDIKDLNKKIIHFAQYNAHRIRGPLARIIGLVHVMNIDLKTNKTFDYELSEFYIGSLKQNATELDEMVKGVSLLLGENNKLLKNGVAKKTKAAPDSTYDD